MNININNVIIKLNNIDYILTNLFDTYQTNDNCMYQINVNVLDNILDELDNVKVSPYILRDDSFITKYYHNKEGIFTKVIYDESTNVFDLLINKELSIYIEETIYIFLGIIVMEIMMENHYLPLHGSALKYGNKAFLLSAPSGTGKSTLRRHITSYNNEVIVINDDKPFLEFKENEVFVFGSPFSGEERLNTNVKTKLSTIYFISRGDTNKVVEISKTLVITELLKNIYKPKDDKLWEVVLKQIELISENVNIKKVEVINDLSAGKFILDILDGEI